MYSVEKVLVGELAWLSDHGGAMLPALGSTLTGRTPHDRSHPDSDAAVLGPEFPRTTLSFQANPKAILDLTIHPRIEPQCLNDECWPSDSPNGAVISRPSPTVKFRKIE